MLHQNQEEKDKKTEQKAPTMWETFMDFIMARKALREAAKQGETKSPPPKGPQNVDYVRKQAEAQAERERKKKLESEAKKGPAKGAANILSNP